MTSRWLFAIMAVAGCTTNGPNGPDGQDCNGGKCDVANGFKGQLDGLNDVIAKYLRASTVDNNGVLGTDFETITEAIAKLQGCATSSIKTFAVSDNLITGADNFPRLINTVCSDDNSKVHDFFIAASFQEMDANNNPTGDIDIHHVEMYAYDAQNKAYHFYRATADSSGGNNVKVEVQPARCRDCHLQPVGLDGTKMAMTPIMNELTQPWGHWNALPDFPSFNYQVPTATQTAPHFSALTQGRLASASRFEQIIRLGHARVGFARVSEQRLSPASVDVAMGLLRPVFCNEQVNYASEDPAGGSLSVTVVIPGGIIEAYRAVQASWPWNWFSAGTIRFSQSPPNPLFMVPVRGNSDIEVENRLEGSLTPQQILRVRALDWTHPVFSDFRCNLWKTAMTNFQTNPPPIDSSQTTASQMSVIFEAIMQLDGMPLKPPSGDVIAMDDAANAGDLASQLASGTISTTCNGSICATDLMGFGALLDNRVTTIQNANDRTTVQTEANRGICIITKNFMNAPELPSVSCQ